MSEVEEKNQEDREGQLNQNIKKFIEEMIKIQGFALGLPNWDLLPPDTVLVRKKGKSSDGTQKV